MLVLAGLAWLLLVTIPWGQWLSAQGNILLIFAVDMFRLGAALALFLVPGAVFFLLLKEKGEDTWDLLGLIPIGFALSVALIEALGLLGRVAGFSFNLVRHLFALAGAAAFVLSLFMDISDIRKKKFAQVLGSLVQNPPLVVALIFVFLLTFSDYLFFIDDVTYGAYVTNWQHSSRLGFQNLIHDPGTVELVRFWLAMFPMSVSWLSAVSGVPGILLLGNYLEPFLTSLAVLTLYWFLRRLGLSNQAAGFSALAQFSLMAWMHGEEWPVGTWFFQSLSEDKVAAVFLLSPVFFAFVLDFLERPTGRNLSLVLASGLGIMLTHPVILFLACVVAAELALFAQISKRANWPSLFLLWAIFILLMIPYAAIRLLDRTGEITGPYSGGQAAATFQIERYANIVSDVFYGLNPGVLKFVHLPFEGGFYAAYQYFRAFPILLLLLAGALSILRLRRGPLYWYLAASILLTFFAAVPYTGWILGYFISARLISRASWFVPLGLSATLIAFFIRERFPRNVSLNFKSENDNRRKRFASFMALALLFCLLFASPANRLPRISAYFEILDRNRQLAQIGAYIDRSADGPVTVIALEYEDTQLLPSVSAQTLLISFREELEYNGFNNFMSIEQIRERIQASNTIRSLDSTIPTQKRCELIRQYRVKFFVIPSGKAEAYRALVGGCAVQVASVFETEHLVLLELK